MDSTKERACWRDLLLISGVGILLFISFLGTRDIWSAGEGRVALVAQQMLNTDNWVIPSLGNRMRMKKPPLAYWLTAIASLPGGRVTVFSSRLPNALAGVGVMLLIYLFGLEWFTRRAALWGALLAGTSGTIWQQARTTGIEMPLLFFSLLGLYAWWRYHVGSPPQVPDGQTSERSRPLGWLLLCYAAFALSALEKAHVGPALFLSIILVYITLTASWGRTTARQFFRHHACGLLLFFVIVLPWVVLVFQRLGEASGTDSTWAAAQIWWGEISGPVKNPDHPEAWYYFLRTAPGDGQPWFFFGLIGLFLPLGKSARSQRGMYLLTTWAVLTIVFFSLPASKKSYYILPVYAALALLGGRLFAAFESGECPEILARVTRWLLAVFGGAAVFLALLVWPIWFVVLHDKPKFQSVGEHLGGLLFISLGLFGVGGYLLFALWKKLRTRALMAMFFLTVSTLAGVVYSYPAQNIHKSKRQVAEYLAPRLRESDRVFTYEVSGSAVFAFYLRHSVERLVETHGIGEQLAYKKIDPRATRVFILMAKKDLTRLRGKTDREQLHEVAHPEVPKKIHWYRFEVRSKNSSRKIL